MPKDKVSGTYQGCGFVEFRTEQDADYAVKTMNTVKKIIFKCFKYFNTYTFISR